MKLLKAVSLFILVIYVAAQAQGVPNVVLSCREIKGGATVLDGAKSLTLGQDQFGHWYLTVLQSDQFVGATTLIKNLLVAKSTCQGYVPCESYLGGQGSAHFFVNLVSTLNQFDGHLESSITGPVNFICHR